MWLARFCRLRICIDLKHVVYGHSMGSDMNDVAASP
jgi:hypothetical protein